jgi:hypothetical protein
VPCKSPKEPWHFGRPAFHWPLQCGIERLLRVLLPHRAIHEYGLAACQSFRTRKQGALSVSGDIWEEMREDVM